MAVAPGKEAEANELMALISRPPEVRIHAIGRTNAFPDLDGL